MALCYTIGRFGRRSWERPNGATAIQLDVLLQLDVLCLPLAAGFEFAATRGG